LDYFFYIHRENSWTGINDFIRKESRQNVEALKNLKNMHSIATQLLNNCDLAGDDLKKADEAAMMLFYILMCDKNSSSSFPSKDLMSEIVQYFGKIDQSAVSEAKEAFAQVFDVLNTSVQNTLQNKLNSWKSGKDLLVYTYDDDKKYFPCGKIKLDYLDPLIATENFDCSTNRLLDISSGMNGSNSEKMHDDKILALFNSDENEKSSDVKIEPPKVTVEKNAAVSSKWDRTFLLNIIGNQDILEAVLPIITSEKSNDEIQEHLFDLLGFDKLELIMNLLENRGSVKKEILKEEALALAVRNQVTNRRPTENHPVIGVRVQSEEERVLEKVYRKENKRAQKGGYDSNSVLISAEAQLGNNMINKVQNGAASHAYRASSGIGAELEIGEYPNVFDSFANAKQKAGFISGVKMVLPENIVRKQTQETEEVSLPAVSATVPAHIAKKPLLKISELDELCRTVFRGMKTLNRIQSLVFETAYKTNENLLICA